MALVQHNRYKVWGVKSVIHCLALFLIIQIYVLALQDNLGADPVEAVLHFTGIGALNLLLLTLCVTPLAQFFKQHWLMQVRRLLGLYAFSYAVCHVLSFLAFEVQFDIVFFLEEVVKRPYITIGLVAFLLLLALAVTSVNGIKKKMGKSWQTLHAWVYFAVLLVAIHFYWSVKSDLVEPLIYLVLVTVLLMLRKRKIKAWLQSIYKK